MAGPVIVERGVGAAPRGAIDLGDAVLVPGFVDLQVNGVGDVDFATADEAGWQRAGRAQLEHGVTAYCPTLITAPLESYAPALLRIEAARTAAARIDVADRSDPDQAVAQILGAHLEGPFLGGAPGAHPLDLVRPADADWLIEALAAAPGVVKLVTLAPEADPAGAATLALVEQGVVVALGHSTATYEQAEAAIEAGARLVTHVFNGMGPLHHRAPGMIGAALTDDRVTPTVIADLVHVHPAVLRLLVNAKPKVALVTDAVSGDRDLDAVRLADGTLAGSTLSMDQAVRNIAALGFPIERAIAMASTIPAQCLGLHDRGRLEPNHRTDVVALDPTTLEVRGVWLAGDRVV